MEFGILLRLVGVMDLILIFISSILYSRGKPLLCDFLNKKGKVGLFACKAYLSDSAILAVGKVVKRCATNLFPFFLSSSPPPPPPTPPPLLLLFPLLLLLHLSLSLTFRLSICLSLKVCLRLCLCVSFSQFLSLCPLLFASVSPLYLCLALSVSGSSSLTKTSVSKTRPGPMKWTGTLTVVTLYPQGKVMDALTLSHVIRWGSADTVQPIWETGHTAGGEVGKRQGTREGWSRQGQREQDGQRERERERERKGERGEREKRERERERDRQTDRQTDRVHPHPTPHPTTDSRLTMDVKSEGTWTTDTKDQYPQIWNRYAVCLNHWQWNQSGCPWTTFTFTQALSTYCRM